MTAQADVDSVSFRQPRLGAGVGVVTICAIAGRARVRHLRGFDLFGLLVVTGDAQCLNVFLREHHFSALRWSVAHFATFLCKRRMREGLYQLWSCGLVRIVTGQAVCSFKRLVLMCPL